MENKQVGMKTPLFGQIGNIDYINHTYVFYGLSDVIIPFPQFIPLLLMAPNAAVMTLLGSGLYTSTLLTGIIRHYRPVSIPFLPWNNLFNKSIGEYIVISKPGIFSKLVKPPWVYPCGISAINNESSQMSEITDKL
jgi:hypothetical protein